MTQEFFWGNSTSSMQTEGGGLAGGKGKSVYDVRENKIWQTAIGNYEDYLTDFDLMKSMNMNMYRFQISWSRVCPEGDGVFNEEGIQFYADMIDALLERGLEPMICLYHFDMPLALAEKYNGFLDRRTEQAFVRYGKEMIDRFADKVKYWIVFNEHNLYFTDLAYTIAGAEQAEKSLNSLYKIFHHTMLAHCELTAYLHETTDAQIGGMVAYTEIYPASSSPADNLAVRQQEEFLYRNLADVYAFGRYSHEVMTFVSNHKIDWDFQRADAEILANGRADFISFSYYRSALLDSSKIPADTAPNHYLDTALVLDKNLPASEWGWSVDATGFRNIITRLYNQYGLPVFPIENGIGLREEWDGEHEIADDFRIAYHQEHINAMEASMELDGAVVLGYLGWGLIDIPSSGGDMEKRYGAVYVNRTNDELRDMKRVPKKSFYYLKEIFGQAPILESVKK